MTNTELPSANPYQKKIFTIPNVLSMIRIGLIPVIIWLYCVADWRCLAGMVFLVSGLTDIVDGFIARKFHMISDLGKILDPIADKLTQATMMLCLISRFPWMMLPFALLLLKESYMTISGFYVIRKTGQVMGAVWHGKLATVCLFAIMLLHIFWTTITPAVSFFSVIGCSVMILLSFVLYAIRNTQAIKEYRKHHNA